MYFPDVSARLEMDATITVFNEGTATPYPGPEREIEGGNPALAFKGLRLRGDKPGLASGYAQVSANVVGRVQISGLSLCLEVSGQSWIGRQEDTSIVDMPWNVVSEVGLEQALNGYDLSFLTPAVEGGGSGKLPIASASTLGGVMVGEGLAVSALGVLSTASGHLLSYTEKDAQEIDEGDSVYLTDPVVLWASGERTLFCGDCLILLKPADHSVAVYTQDEAFAVGSVTLALDISGTQQYEIRRK
jgi:hypothetical protein